MDDKLLRLARKIKTIEEDLSKITQIKDLEGLLFVNTEITNKYKKSINDVVNTYKDYILKTQKELSESMKILKKQNKENTIENKNIIKDLENKTNKIKEDIKNICVSLDKSIENIQKDILKDIKVQNDEIGLNLKNKDKEISLIKKENKALKDNLIKLRELFDKIELQKGEAGKSAYEIACELGFKGTVEEWIKSLHGKDGKEIELRGMRAFSDAPKDNKTYARKNKKWVEVEGSDLTDYVKNTDYASSSKGGVFKVGSGLEVNSSNGYVFATNYNYSTYNTASNNNFISKGTLENVIAGKQLTNQTQLDESQETQDEEIEKLQTENAKLKATLPTTTGEGQDVTLDKTAEFEFVKPPLPMGNSEQFTTTGKNLAGIIDVMGNHISKDEDKITYSSGAYASDFVNLEQKELEANQEYIFEMFLVSKSTNTNTVEILIKDTTNTNFFDIFKNIGGNTTYYSQSFTPTTVRTLNKLQLYCPQSAPLTGDVVFRFQIRKANTSEGYELYTNGASPNPDYPQNINNVTGNVEVVVSNANSTKSQTFTFPLGNEKLMLGDYLADDGIHHVRGQVVLNGTETWWENTNYTTEQMLVASAILTGMKTGTTNIISSIAKYANPTVINSIRAMGGIIGIGLDKTQFSTVSDFTTWLSTHNVTVEYELEQEVIVPYTSAQQEVYNQIKQAISYEEQTNISSNQNALFSVEAYQSTKLILQNIDSRLILVEG